VHSRWQLRGIWIPATRRSSQWHRLTEMSVFEIERDIGVDFTRQGGDGLKVGRVAFAQSDCNGLQTVHGQNKDDG
jgi:hypothetical protein